MSLVSEDDLSWIAEGKYKSNIDSIVVLYKSEKGVPHNRKKECPLRQTSSNNPMGSPPISIN